MTHISESDGLSLSIPITKATEAEDGSVYVEGLCTDDGLDLDDQIIDRDFAIKGLADWFSEWGNVRQQHSSNLPPAGKAVDMEVRPEGVWIRARIVEPTAAKLVKEKVYSAFSVGVSQPRIIRDPEGLAKNGRVVDGIFSEVSVVDYPANPRAKFSLAKRAPSGEIEVVEKAVEVELTKAVPTPRDVFVGYDKGGILPSGLTEVTNQSGEAIAIEKRDMDPNVGGGVDRDKLKDSDFVFPDERDFPVVTPADVTDAVSSWGRYKGKHSFADFKRNLTALAHRKGPSFVSELPKEWTEESKKSADAETTAVEPELTKGARDCAGCGKSHHADSSATYCADCGKKLPDAAVEKSAEAEVVAPEAPAETEPAGAEAEAAPVEKAEEPELAKAAGYQPKPYHADPDETVKCPKCGKMNDTDAKFCDQCGFKLEGASGVQVKKSAEEHEAALDAELVKSIVAPELVKFAPAAEVEALRADLAEEQGKREALEKRISDIESSPDPHQRAYRGAALSALRPKAEETSAGTGEADAVAVKALEATIMKARSDIGGVHFEKLMKQFGPEVAAKLVSD